MNLLYEIQILNNIQLSGIQKAILAKIIAAPTPELAYAQISNGINFVASRDILQKLQLIDIHNNVASITKEGKRIMKNENLIDSEDELTPDGQQFVDETDPNKIKSHQSDSDEDITTGTNDELGSDIPDRNQMESLIQIIDANRALLSETLPPITFTLLEVCRMETETDLSPELLDKIQQFVVEHDASWMPKYTQESRLSDPHKWIMNRLPQIVKIITTLPAK